MAKYDMLELLDVANGDYKVKLIASQVEQRRKEAFNRLMQLESEAWDLHKSFCSKIAKMSDARRQFLGKKACLKFSELLRDLDNAKCDVYFIIHEQIDLTNKKELFAEKPFESVFNIIEGRIKICESRNMEYDIYLKNILSNDNIFKVSLIEKFAEKIIDNFEQMGVYRSIKESEMAKIHLHRGINDHVFVNAHFDLYYTGLYISENSNKPFLIFTNNIDFYKIVCGSEDVELLIEDATSEKCIDEFINDIGEMLMLLVSHIEVTVISNTSEGSDNMGWTITMKLKK